MFRFKQNIQPIPLAAITYFDKRNIDENLSYRLTPRSDRLRKCAPTFLMQGTQRSRHRQKQPENGVLRPAGRHILEAEGIKRQP